MSCMYSPILPRLIHEFSKEFMARAPRAVGAPHRPFDEQAVRDSIANSEQPLRGDCRSLPPPTTL